MMAAWPWSLGFVLTTALVALIIPQIALTAWFASLLRARTRSFVERSEPRRESANVAADVVLCLRDCDPTLTDVLASLARQKHRNWHLRVVVDSTADPAWKLADETLARLATEPQVSWRSYSIEPLATRPVRGSLKCASLRQALGALSPATRVVALIDADSVVHDDWLVTLVDECLRPGVGAVSGNRWYAPADHTVPATVRAIWNAGAIVQMSVFGIPWGGSLAVRREALEDCGWADVIRATLCEDTALAGPLRRAGWQYRFIPALIAVDSDAHVALGPLTRWIARQLLTARLHHPMWPLVACHAISTSIVLLGAISFCLLATAGLLNEPASMVAGALVGYEFISGALVFWIEAAVCDSLRASGRQVRPTSAARAAWQIFMIPPTQLVYAAAAVIALFTRTIEWRGVVYEIRRPQGMLEVLIASDSRHRLEAWRNP